MAHIIDDLLKSEGSTTYFIMVGAGHYISDYSVLEILKEIVMKSIKLNNKV